MNSVFGEKRKNYLMLILCQAYLLLSADALAARNSDFQSWNNLTVMAPLSGKIRYWLEAQGRLGMNVSSLSQSLLRPGIGYQINKESSIWTGYAWVYTKKPFSQHSLNEHRLWQQYLWIKDYSWIRGFSRTRLEQRFIENVSRTGWRFRQFFRLQLPLNDNQYFLSANEEVFLRLNNTSNTINNRGFDQNRVFVGLGFYPWKSWLLEAGYQNQLINRPSIRHFIGNSIVVNFIGNLN